MINKLIKATTITFALLPLLAFAPRVSADGSQTCVGQYGQVVSCGPQPSVAPHAPVEAGLADIINPLTVGSAFIAASGALYIYSKRRVSSI